LHSALSVARFRCCCPSCRASVGFRFKGMYGHRQSAVTHSMHIGCYHFLTTVRLSSSIVCLRRRPVLVNLPSVPRPVSHGGRRRCRLERGVLPLVQWTSYPCRIAAPGGGGRPFHSAWSPAASSSSASSPSSWLSSSRTWSWWRPSEHRRCHPDDSTPSRRPRRRLRLLPLRAEGSR
jgi:hypothetical protein